MPAIVHKFPAPPPATREGTAPLASETHHIVRERAFSSSTSLNEILRELHASHATGTLTLNMNQGSVASVTFHEKQKVSFD